MSFVPIQFEKYVQHYLEGNPSADREDIVDRLKYALDQYKAGARCHCGSRIWVIGSAEVGLSCFTCITGEASPSDDYEIDEACPKPSP